MAAEYALVDGNQMPRLAIPGRAIIAGDALEPAIDAQTMTIHHGKHHQAYVTNLNKALNVVLIATECSDGMSDRTYPLTAKVEIGDDELTGCAAPASMLTTQPAP